MSTDDQPTLEELENLFVNNPEIDEIRTYVGRFNPIKMMGVEQKEIRHSYILRWLLDPQESHGLRDKFLKAFLAEALRGQDDSGGPSALDVYQADMMDAEIKIEWSDTKGRRIDLLILTQKNHWIFVIENKFNSTQGEDQLKDYMDSVEKKFSVGEGGIYKSARGIFLTLWDEPFDENRYAPINYDSICELLEQQILSGRYPLTAEVETFLKHYLEIIQEETENENQENMEIKNLAWKIYRDNKRVIDYTKDTALEGLYQNHRNVVDFIIEHGKSTVFLTACEMAFKGEAGKEVNFAYLDYPDLISASGCEFALNYAEPRHISFVPKLWAKKFKNNSWSGCEDLTYSGFPLIMVLSLKSSNKIFIYCRIYTQNREFRSKLIEAIESAAEDDDLKIKFRKTAMHEKHPNCFTSKFNSFKVDNGHDVDCIKDTILKALTEFKPEIDAVTEAVIKPFLDFADK